MAARGLHTPTRSCRVCRTRAAKRELERWVVTAGQLTLDKNQVMPGRGVYTCASNCSRQIDQFIGPRQRGRKGQK